MHHADCREILEGIADESIDSIVTDPPYALVSGTKPTKGFMGQSWDTGETAFSTEFWSEVLRVLKPGGHVVAFGGTRTYHRLAVAIEDAGFEIRDQLGWLYGTGFPKSLDVSKAIDRAAGAERAIVGINPNHRAESGVAYDGVYAGGNTGAKDITAPATPEAAQWRGWGTALKPAWEPIVLARKPLIGTVATNVLAHETGAINVDGCRVGAGEARQTATGGMGRKANPVFGSFADASTSTLETTVGRWPANIVHDGSPEVVAMFPDSNAGAVRPGKTLITATAKSDGWGNIGQGPNGARFGDSGSASRFFYCAKASRADRAGSKHPTVKPLALMRWLVRLVTPPGGTILEPFAGSGTTLQAAVEEGFNIIGIEREEQYFLDSCERLTSLHQSNSKDNT